MISHVGTPEADSSGNVRVIGMVIRVVFMSRVKNLCSYGRLSCWDEGCKSGTAIDITLTPALVSSAGRL